MKPALFDNMLVWLRRNKCSNGFALTETVIAAVCTVLILSACLPLALQMTLVFHTGERWEELARQGMVLDETIYNTLRYAGDIVVADSSVRCRDEQNTLTGFTVKNGRVYRFMGNGNEQPLTGTSNAGIESKIYVLQDDQPYFSKKGEVIYIRIVLHDAVSGRSWPCYMAVKPLKGGGS